MLIPPLPSPHNVSSHAISSSSSNGIMSSVSAGSSGAAAGSSFLFSSSSSSSSFSSAVAAAAWLLLPSSSSSSSQMVVKGAGGDGSGSILSSDHAVASSNPVAAMELNDIHNSNNPSAQALHFYDSLHGDFVSGADTFNNVTNGSTTLWTPTSRACLTVSLAVVMAMAVVGNLMVVGVILQNRGMRTRTNLLLCNLAVAHLLCAAVDMPLSMMTLVNGGWMVGEVACVLSGFVSTLVFVISVHTLMYISVHKCVSIRHPYCQVLSHGRVVGMICTTWLWAVLVATISITGLNHVSYQPYSTICSVVFPPSTLLTYIHSALTAVTTYLIPLIVLCTCYLIMYIEIRTHWRGAVVGGTITQKDVIYSQQQRISTTLFIVLLAFVVLWTPYFLLQLYSAILAQGKDPPPLAEPITYICGYLSCAVNPLIYAIRSPAFRDGYRHILCKDPDTMSSTDTEYDSAYSKPMRKFRAYLRETLHGTAHVHGSGSLTGSVCGSLPASRKSSMTSLTNFLLMPKMRSLSTNSLPGNFRFSLNQRLLTDSDTTKVSIIAGIPVLTKAGKIVCYQNPHETPRRKIHNPVYYPPVGASKLTHHPTAPASMSSTERSALLQPVLQHDELMYAGAAKVPAHVTAHCPQYMSPTHHYPNSPSHRPRRPSCESGYSDSDNDDDDDDAVFIVVAAEVEVDPSKHRQQQHRGQRLEEHSASLEGLLEGQISPKACTPVSATPTRTMTQQPQPSSSKPRVCKSVSDAPHVPSLGARSVTKSTSDTCIQEASSASGNDGSGTELGATGGVTCHSIQYIDDDEEEDEEEEDLSGKKPHGKSMKRRNILSKIFTRGNKEKQPPPPPQSQSRFYIPQLQERGPPATMMVVPVTTRGGDSSDVSDSGLVSGILESPKLSHTLPRNKSKRSGSAVYQAIRRPTPSTLDPNVMHKSSSDPCLDEGAKSSASSSSKQKSKNVGKSKLKHRKSATSGGKNSKRHQQNNGTKDSTGDILGDVNINSELHRMEMGMGKRTGRMKPFPSVEKLDFDVLRVTSSNSGGVDSGFIGSSRHRTGRHSHKTPRSGIGALRLYSADNNDILAGIGALEYEHKRHRSDAGNDGNTTGGGGAHKSLSSSPSARGPALLYRSFSDPNLTVKRIEEKVLQRTLTRKWTKTQKTRRKKRSRQQRLSVVDNVTSSRSLDSADINQPGPSSRESPASPPQASTPLHPPSPSSSTVSTVSAVSRVSVSGISAAAVSPAASPVSGISSSVSVLPRSRAGSVESVPAPAPGCLSPGCLSPGCISPASSQPLPAPCLVRVVISDYDEDTTYVTPTSLPSVVISTNEAGSGNGVKTKNGTEFVKNGTKNGTNGIHDAADNGKGVVEKYTAEEQEKNGNNVTMATVIPAADTMLEEEDTTNINTTTQQQETGNGNIEQQQQQQQQQPQHHSESLGTTTSSSTTAATREIEEATTTDTPDTTHHPTTTTTTTTTTIPTTRTENIVSSSSSTSSPSLPPSSSSFQ